MHLAIFDPSDNIRKKLYYQLEDGHFAQRYVLCLVRDLGRIHTLIPGIPIGPTLPVAPGRPCSP